jgi:hypothetical protein
MELIKDERLEEVNGGWTLNCSRYGNNQQSILLSIPNESKVLRRFAESGIIDQYNLFADPLRTISDQGIDMSEDERRELVREANPNIRFSAIINNSQYEDFTRRLSEILD